MQYWRWRLFITFYLCPWSRDDVGRKLAVDTFLALIPQAMPQRRSRVPRRAPRSMLTGCAHTSLPLSARDLCQTNATTHPCRLPKSNPEATSSISSACIVRCFTLKRGIQHVLIASLGHRWEKKQGSILESLTCCTRTGTLPQEPAPSISLAMSFLRLQSRRVGYRVQEGKNQLLPHIQWVLTFPHMGVLSQCMTFFPVLCIVSSFLLHPRLCWNCPDPAPLHKDL